MKKRGILKEIKWGPFLFPKWFWKDCFRDYYGADDDDDDDDAKGDYDYGAKKEGGGGGGGGYDDEEEAQPDVEYDHGVYVSKYVENKVNVFRCAFNKYRRKTTENNDR